jgi:hypothetical protein
MIPIEKNIRVVDAFNNEYEPTYPKRAKGLVKNGRASFVDANTICLLNSPKNKMEDIKMADNMTPTDLSQSSNSKANEKFSLNYVLEQIEKISSQTEYITRAFDAVTSIENGEIPECGSPGNMTGQAKAEAIGEIVKSRETTNQKLLQLYEKMYDDLKPAKQRTETDVSIIQAIVQAASGLPPEKARDFLREQINKVF